ncbi:unnamed protein product [Pseudo-nitzschia multistriata]|uniref:Sm domain-containing protein n=1 Tax=Pseudo-nitzschia multistriata TaxID=183589 RepID=A0A448YYE2_9STRA|nr:unnamed protein product [Pseudo-nitzschia multistriata]
MNEESSSSSSKRRGPTTYPPPDASAATDDATEASLTRRSKNDRIPLSLGKASLRIRLEAYYSLISPAILSDRTAWLRKYDQIYEKYGGTHSGERKLATKLAKKYGTAVRLLLVSDSSSLVPRFPTDSNRSNDLANTRKSNLPRDESWYQLRKEEAGSGIVDFLSSRFDPVEALTGASGRGSVARANPWMEELLPKTILDNIGKCAALLPTDDPLRKENHLQLQLRKSAASRNSSSQQNQLALGTAAAAESVQIRPTTLRKQTNHDLHPFEAIASHLDTGPHSLLFRLRRDRKRARVVVRYVNMVRGTITGSLVAFDKHMNLILRDAEAIA